MDAAARGPARAGSLQTVPAAARSAPALRLPGASSPGSRAAGSGRRDPASRRGHGGPGGRSGCSSAESICTSHLLSSSAPCGFDSLHRACSDLLNNHRNSITELETVALKLYCSVLSTVNCWLVLNWISGSQMNPSEMEVRKGSRLTQEPE